MKAYKTDCHCNERHFSFTMLTMWLKGLPHISAVSHLREGQAVLVGLFVFQLKVIQSFALRRRLRQRLDDLDKVGREEAVHSSHLPVVPVFIHLPAQDYDVALREFEISWFLPIIVVQRFGTRELWDTLKMRKWASFITPESTEKHTSLGNETIMFCLYTRNLKSYIVSLAD